MANTGLKRFRYALLDTDGITYGTVKTMAGAISSSVNLNIPEATLYSDNAIREYVTGFQSATITLGVDDDNDTIFAEILGKTIDLDDLVTSNVDDTPPYVGFGHIVTKLVDNTPFYKVEWFPKVKFKPFIADAKTKSESIEFGTPNVEGMIIANDEGVWEKHQTFTSETEANTALDEFFTQSTGG